MVKVWAKLTNCSVFGCTDEHRTLFRVPASEETRELWIYWFIYCMLLPHRSKIITQFISQPFTFTDITDCFCNSCVFNVNLCVNENLVYSHAVTAAFCPCASDVCTQKTIYQKFKLMWFKTHDFSTINMIIRTKTDVFSRYELKWRSSILERGRDQQLIWI